MAQSYKLLFNCANLCAKMNRRICEIDVRVKILQNASKIKNTRHSSGIWVNAKSISSMEPDEYPDDSSGTRQVVIG